MAKQRLAVLILLSTVCLVAPTVGAQTLVPLDTWWSSSRTDLFNTATAQGAADAGAVGYSKTRCEASIWSTQQPGSVPLQLLWSDARQDNDTAATSAGIGDAVAAGYRVIRTEGYVSPTQLPGMIPLNLYWSDALADNVLIGGGATIPNAPADSYRFIRTEGYAYPCGGGPAQPTRWNGTSPLSVGTLIALHDGAWMVENGGRLSMTGQSLSRNAMFRVTGMLVQEESNWTYIQLSKADGGPLLGSSGYEVCFGCEARWLVLRHGRWVGSFPDSRFELYGEGQARVQILFGPPYAVLTRGFAGCVLARRGTDVYCEVNASIPHMYTIHIVPPQQ